jgi:hypothetical protein
MIKNSAKIKGVVVTIELILSNKQNPAVPGSDYEQTTVNLEFPEGEVLQTV